ncbi:MAG: hypothetical protein K6A74_11855 [Lachnospiraceae bacterium]|nr:hypothetical protein [Lachnospiraceae bacterium]
MDKYEYNLRADEIRNLIAEDRYTEAAEIADTVDWRNVKSGNMLCTVSDLYKICKRYEDARDVLLLAYDRNPRGKLIIYSLCELSIKINDVVNAVEYYKEYLQVCGNDTGKYILHYKLLEAQEASLAERISILEEFQKRECKSKWMYELAFLYHRMGLASSCIDECDQIVLFFGEGKYVIKALELKSLHVKELPHDQALLYERLTTPYDEISVPEMNPENPFNTRDLTNILAEGIKEVLPSDETRTEPTMIPTKEITQEMVEPEETDEKVFIVGKVPESAETDSDTKVIPEIPEDTDTKVIPPVEEENDTKVIPEIMPEMPGESEAGEAGSETKVIPPIEEDTDTKAIPTITEHVVDKDVVEYTADTVYEEAAEEEPKEAFVDTEAADEQISMFDESASLSLGKTRVYSKDEIEKALGGSEVTEDYTDEEGHVSFEHNFDDVLTLEGDGQISLVVPEEKRVTKQITGQISLTEALLEYEKSVQEKEKKWSDGIRSQIEKSYDSILKDFDETSKDGLLEQIEEKIENERDTMSALFKEEPEEEVYIIDEDEETKEVTEEPSEETEDEPTPEELSFDRTPFVEGSEETAEPEEPSESEESEEPAEEPEEESAETKESSETSKPAESGDAGMDYLMAFAAAGEERDLAEAAAMESLNKILEEEEQEKAAAASKEDAETEETEPAKPSKEEETSEETEETPEETDSSEEAEEEEEPESTESSADENETDLTPTSLPDHEGFTDAQWHRFESFVQTEVAREQIREALENISEAANRGNVIIGSIDQDSAVELGKELAAEISDRGVLTPQLSKAKASVLNARDVDVIFSERYDSSILIQDADELRDATLENMKRMMSDPEKNILVILTVSHRLKHKFIMDHADLLEYFNVSIDIDALDNAELVRLAREYAYNKEFSIDEMGTLALHRRIDERQTNSHSVLLKEVKEIVDEAIKNATKFKAKHFFDLISGKRYDKNDMIVLGEKDFIEK